MFIWQHQEKTCKLRKRTSLKFPLIYQQKDEGWGEGIKNRVSKNNKHAFRLVYWLGSWYSSIYTSALILLKEWINDIRLHYIALQYITLYFRCNLRYLSKGTKISGKWLKNKKWWLKILVFFYFQTMGVLKWIKRRTSLKPKLAYLEKPHTKPPSCTKPRQRTMYLNWKWQKIKFAAYKCQFCATNIITLLAGE